MPRRGEANKDPIVNVRVPREFLERLERLEAALERDATIRMSGGKVTRSTVLRLALLRGVEALEEAHGISRKRGR